MVIEWIIEGSRRIEIPDEKLEKLNDTQISFLVEDCILDDIENKLAWYVVN